ncbi:MAG: M42 family metallopeptidase [Desulfurococcales archaeon]|nr:M42 family metallopeptidase [Desulfurococcales archaeon]
MVSMGDFYVTLKTLAETISVAGYEDELRELVIEFLKPYADELYTDSLGNVIAVKKGKGKGKVMVAAHMDEIGLMVSHIDKNGFLRLQPIGGWNPLVLPGQRLLIKGTRGIVRGVIGMTPPHILKEEEAKKIPEIRKLFVDVGARNKDEVEDMGIKVGSIAVIERTVEKIGEHRVTGRAFDDKVGVAALIHAFREAEPGDVDFYAVVTVQEEVGLKGARVAAYRISPDVALAVDVTVAADVPGVPGEAQIAKLGEGPAIKIMDGRSGSGLLAHPAVREKLIEVARTKGIPFQLEILPGGTTDAAIIALNKEGVPAGTVSVPTRYIHSPVEVLDLRDAVNTVKLLTGFVDEITEKWITELRGMRIL